MYICMHIYSPVPVRRGRLAMTARRHPQRYIGGSNWHILHIYVCMHTYLYSCVYAYICLCTHYMYIYLSIYMGRYLFAEGGWRQQRRVAACSNISGLTPKIYLHIYVCMHAYLYLCVYEHICVCTHLYRDISIYRYGAVPVWRVRLAATTARRHPQR